MPGQRASRADRASLQPAEKNSVLPLTTN